MNHNIDLNDGIDLGGESPAFDPAAEALRRTDILLRAVMTVDEASVGACQALTELLVDVATICLPGADGESVAAAEERLREFVAEANDLQGA